MKLRAVLVAFLLVLTLAVPAQGQALAASGQSGCTTVASGTLVDSMGNPLSLGFDQFGYNYQAHIFVGTYDSSDRNLDGLYWGDPASVDYADDSLIMKWSDAWLANVDCNGDGKLDRGLIDGTSDGISKGWLTNEVNGDYVGADGNLHHYTEFTKIVWVGPGGSLWGQYEIIQDVYNDPYGGFHGLDVKVGPPGFGQNDQWTTH